VQVLLVIGIIYTLLFPRTNLYAHLGGLAGGIILFSNMQRRRS
jgi:membrane associated rhomboid family serine protease